MNRPWWQWRLEVNRDNLPTTYIVGWLAAFIGVSLLAALAFALGPSARGPAGGVGMPAAITGMGLSLWCAIRLRRWSFVGMVVLSCVPAAIWGWLFYWYALIGVRT
jgi:hypothetical protein